MLKLKYTLVFVMVFFLILSTLDIVFGISFWWYLIPLGLLLFFITLGSFRIDLSFYLDVICKIKSENKVVLTFDDGPDEFVTPKVLEVLKKHNVKAVFFIIGDKAESIPSLVKQAFDDGHIIANHSCCHRSLYGFYPSQKVMVDIDKSQEIIKNIIGLRPRFFRPPFGVTNPNMKIAIQRLRLIAVGWSLRSLDTVQSNLDKLSQRISKVKAGDIVLFHDRVQGIEHVLEDFIISCRQQHLDFIRLDEALKMEAYE